MSLNIYLLGQFKLEAGSQPLDLPSRPAQSLLAYLSLYPGVKHRREKLSGLLWPDASDKNARAYLRQALWRIRNSLTDGLLNPDDYLQIRDIDIVFNERSDYWLDVEDLLESTESLSTTKLLESVQLYQGELLPGFYDDWIVSERDRILAAFHKKMGLLLDRLMREERWDDSLEWGEHWIRLGYAPEPAFRVLMRTYAALGDQIMVSNTFRRCEEVLTRELGLEPATETQHLYEQLAQGVPAFPAPSYHKPVKQRPPFLDDDLLRPKDRPVFVAREVELAKLGNHMELALKGQGRVVFVIGEAGSGKTTLIQEFADHAQEDHPDLIVADGKCNAYTGIGDPYLPFREILALLTGDVEPRWNAGTISRQHAIRLWHLLPETARALLEIGPGLIDTFVQTAPLLDRTAAHVPDGAGWLDRLGIFLAQKSTNGHSAIGSFQSGLFEQYTRVVVALAQRHPLLLVLDDLQWADPGSISLLFHLGSHLRGVPILLVGAYRPEDVGLDDSGKRHALLPVVNQFRRTFGDILLNVDRIEGQKFIDDFLDSEPNQLGSAFRKMLYEQTRGHPLFTIELLRGLQARGDLFRDTQGIWMAGTSLDWETLPGRIEAAIQERIDRLSQENQRTLEVASVEGDLFTAEVLAQVREIAEEDMLDCLSSELDQRHRLIKAHSIQRVGGQLISTYRFQHILFQKYIYSSLDEVKRVHLHEQVGSALESLYRLHKDYQAEIGVQLARHFQAAGNVKKAIKYLHKAGDKAVQLTAFHEGSAYLSKALDMLFTQPDSPERSREELGLQLSLGMSWLWDVSSQKWKQIYDRALELAKKIGDTSPLCRILDEIAAHHFVRGEHLQARPLAKEALELAQGSDDPILRAQCHWFLGFVLFALGEYKKAHYNFDQIIATYLPQQHNHFIALRGSDAGLSAQAYDSCCLWALGYPDQARKRSQEAMALGRKFNHPFSFADVLAFSGGMLNAMRRNYAELEASADELIRLTDEKDFHGYRGTGLCYKGIALILSGKNKEGMIVLRDGISECRSTNVHLFESVMLCFLAEASANSGYLDDGLSSLDKAFEFVEKSGEGMWESELHRMKGELVLLSGDENGAEACFRKAIDVARFQRTKSWELRGVIGLASLMIKQGRKTQALKNLTEISEWFTEGWDTPDLIMASKLIEELSS